MSHSFRIRPAVPADVPLLPDLERRAAVLFRDRLEELGLREEMLEKATGEPVFRAAQQENRLLVAERESRGVVGFALIFMVDGLAHLKELDVVPEEGRRGIGATLLESVCEWAALRGIPEVTLCTFRDVPWNGPFYAKHGFEAVAPGEVSPGHVVLVDGEKDRGLRPDLRILMRRKIGAV